MGDEQATARITDQLHEFLESPDMAGRRIEPDEDLLDGGALDSLKLLALVARVEELMSGKVPLEDILPENFGTISAIETYLHADSHDRKQS